MNSPVSNKSFDLCIIGGGINGAGVCLEAALRGLSVLLLEKNDFGGYTTSASTKLIHGGLRYLEHFEFSLVRESLRERELLLKNAPHLVKPLQLKIPIYKQNRHSAFTLRMGMILYDLLSYDKTLPRHSFKKVKAKVEDPSLDGLDCNNLDAIISYYDCQIEYPERLCLELILSAKETGATILNHHKFVERIDSQNGFHQLTIDNQLTNERSNVEAQVIVNCGGAFVDEVNKQLHNKVSRLMGGTKGSHIVIEQFDNGPTTGLYMEAKSDGRQFFIIPWRNYYLIGTTDIYFEHPPDSVIASEVEIDYLTKEFNNFFPNRNLKKEEIVYTYSGVRPLLYEPDKSEGAVTRKHVIVNHAKVGLNNCFSIVGGKITTYRNLAEETVDKVSKILKSNIASSTKTKALFGGKDFNLIASKMSETITLIADKFRLDTEIIEHLISFYGSKFENVLTMINDDTSLKERIDPQYPCIFAQVAYGILVEEAKSLDDIILRRTMLGTVGDLGYHAASKIADVAARYLAWDDERKKMEIAAYRDLVVHKFHSKYARESVL